MVYKENKMDTKQFFRLTGFSYEKYEKTRKLLTQGNFNHARLALKIILDRAADLEIPTELKQQYSIAVNGVLGKQLNDLADTLKFLSGEIDLHLLKNISTAMYSIDEAMKDPNAEVLDDYRTRFRDLVEDYRASSEVANCISYNLGSIDEKLQPVAGTVSVHDLRTSTIGLSDLEIIFRNNNTPVSHDDFIKYDTLRGTVRRYAEFIEASGLQEEVRN